MALAKRMRTEDRSCPLSTTARHVGEWWTLLLLHDLFDGYTRFDQFQESLGISSSMLTTRLKTLVADGLLERRPYQTNPVRHEYVLTELGMTLRPVIVTMAAWGNARLAPDRRSMILVDAASGEEVEPVVVDARTGRRLDDSEAYVFTAGPAAGPEMRARYVPEEGAESSAGREPAAMPEVRSAEPPEDSARMAESVARSA